MWRKLGHVFAGDGRSAWIQSHAFVPVPIELATGGIRVFVAFLDEHMIGRVGWVDVDPADPSRVRAVSERPALDIGAPGCFDDSGATPVQVVAQAGKLYLFYNGWQRSQGVPYHIFSGLAVSEDEGLTFRRLSSVPILDRTDTGTLVRSTPYVVPPSGQGDRWRMWYCAGSDCIERRNGRWAPTYNICYAESDRLDEWPRVDEIVIRPVGDEFGLTRPVVTRDVDGFTMLLSVRSQSEIYRIEEATSPDGRTWRRWPDRRPVLTSADGWDSEMVAFPGLISVGGRTFMFYNGNGYGREGFGVAERIQGERPR